MLFALLLACVPPDPPVRSFVDVPAAPPRALPFQTETQAWELVQDTLTGAGIPKLQTANLGFSEQVLWSTSEGTVVILRRFLVGPAVADEHLSELGLDDASLASFSENQRWEGYQAMAVGSLAYELARVSGRERGAELPPEAEAARAAAVERALLRELAATGQIPASWPDAHQGLICLLASGPTEAELSARARCAAASAAPTKLDKLAVQFEPPPLDIFAAIAAPDARGPAVRSGRLADDPTGLDLRVQDEESAVAVFPPDEAWRLELQLADRPDELRAVLVLPIAQRAELRTPTLGLVNAMNLALGSERVLTVLNPEGLVFWVSRWPVESDASPLELTQRLVRLATSVQAALPGVLGGTITPELAAEAASTAMLGAEPEAP